MILECGLLVTVAVYWEVIIALNSAKLKRWHLLLLLDTFYLNYFIRVPLLIFNYCLCLIKVCNVCKVCTCAVTLQVSVILLPLYEGSV